MAATRQFSGLATTIYDMTYKWLAGQRSGLAIRKDVIFSMIAVMGGVRAFGTVATVLPVYPEIWQRHYDKSMAIGPMTFRRALGPLITPEYCSFSLVVLSTFPSASCRSEASSRGLKWPY